MNKDELFEKLNDLFANNIGVFTEEEADAIGPYIDLIRYELGVDYNISYNEKDKSYTVIIERGLNEISNKRISRWH